MEYTLLLTTGGGLYRYKLCDRVIVDDFVHQTPSLRFLGQDDRVSDLFGEKLSDGFVARVLEQLFTGRRPDSRCWPRSHRPRHRLHVVHRSDGPTDPDLADRLERALRLNPHTPGAWISASFVRRAWHGSDPAHERFLDACVAGGSVSATSSRVAVAATGWRDRLPQLDVEACDNQGLTRPGSTLIGWRRRRRPREEPIDWQTPIDRSRWFFCETLTPLYYTACIRIWRENRRRYNQLTAMLANEIIALHGVRVPRRGADRRSSLGRSAATRTCTLPYSISRRRARHAEIWELNRLSEPEWYGPTDRRLHEHSPRGAVAARLIARHPVLSRSCSGFNSCRRSARSRSHGAACASRRRDRTAVRGRLRGAPADEARHVQIDRHLIELLPSAHVAYVTAAC